MIRLGLVLNSTRLWWNAWRDARRRTPATDSSAPAETERLIVDCGRLALRRLARRASERLSTVRSELQHAEQALTRATELVMNITAPCSTEQLTTDRRLSPLVSWPALLALASVEAWFNKHAFDTLGEEGFTSLALAVVLGVGLPLIADVFGTQLRQERWTRNRVVAWGVLLTVVLAMLIASAGLRLEMQSVLSQAESTHPLNTIGASRAPISEGTKAVPTLSPAQTYRLFLVVNIFLFTTAVFVGAFGADSRRGYASGTRAMRRSSARRDALLDEVARLEEVLEQLEERVIDLVRERVRFYRLVHARYRGDPPRFFADASHPSHDPAGAIAGSASGRVPDNVTPIRQATASRAPDVQVTSSRGAEVRWTNRSPSY